jgi:hypothetical protein
MTNHVVCPVCKTECEFYQTSFSKEGTWCNHEGWVIRTGASIDDPPILYDKDDL